MVLSVDYKGKLVLITGGGRGIGKGITTALAKAGADVAITYTSQDPSSFASELSSTHSVNIKAFKCNVKSSSEIDACVDAVTKAYGKKVDIAIANAGVSLWKQAHENTDEDIENMFAVNTLGPFYFSRAVVRSWLDLPVAVSGGGEVDVTKIKDAKLDKQILFISSISGLVAMSPQRQAAYNASKGGLTMLAKEWAHLGIYVNSISPGYVATDMITNPTNPEDAAFAKEWDYRTPVGRLLSKACSMVSREIFATADEIGEFVAVLLSRYQGGGGFLSGSDVVYDGGYTTL